MTQAFSYIRFSTLKQQSGDSLRRQREATEAYCTKHDLKLSTQSFHDLGVSAFKGKHRQSGALALFIKAVEDGAIEQGSYLIIESFDRLSREKVELVLQLFLRLRELQINIVTLTDNQQYLVSETLDMTQLIVSIVIMSRSHEESATKSIRIKQAHQATRNKIKDGKGIWSGSYPPWLTLNDSRDGFVVITERAKVVRDLFKMSLDNLGLTTICNTLIADKVPVFSISRSKSKVWTRDHVKRILQNVKTTGLNIVDDVEIPDHYPRVISDDTFYRSEALMQRRKTFVGRNPKNKNFNAFRGILSCQCGGRMYSVRMERNGKVYSYLSCRNGCKPSLQYPFFEEKILTLLPFVNFKSIFSKDCFIDKVSVIESELSHLTNQIETLTDKALSDDLPVSLLKRLKVMELKQGDLSEDLKVERSNENANKDSHLDDMLKLISKLKIVGKDEAFDIRKNINNTLCDTFTKMEVKVKKTCTFELKCYLKDDRVYHLNVNSNCQHSDQDFSIEGWF